MGARGEAADDDAKDNRAGRGDGDSRALRSGRARHQHRARFRPLYLGNVGHRDGEDSSRGRARRHEPTGAPADEASRGRTSPPPTPRPGVPRRIASESQADGARRRRHPRAGCCGGGGDLARPRVRRQPQLHPAGGSSQALAPRARTGSEHSQNASRACRGLIFNPGEIPKSLARGSAGDRAPVTARLERPTQFRALVRVSGGLGGRRSSSGRSRFSRR